MKYSGIMVRLLSVQGLLDVVDQLLKNLSTFRKNLENIPTIMLKNRDLDRRKNVEIVYLIESFTMGIWLQRI